MATKNATVTITGNIGNDPTYNTTRTGDAVVNFRVGSSSGYWNRSTGAWVDEGTSWYSVSAFRNLAEHAKASLRRGDPVIVTGALKVKEWENDGRKGISADIVADAIGHDLGQGTSAFVRRPHANAGAERPQVQAQGAPPATAETEAAEFPGEPAPEEHVDEWRANGMTVDDAAQGSTVDEEDAVFA
ncbi:single-stranded DNA-binding protein [Microbacterium sp. Mu-80]|uniref:Single-stranded DNA-binding protein n=1 Tax=Microbacterium bandirmense TaxID=3122050 RepID=A0ABU8L6M9_9MICO